MDFGVVGLDHHHHHHPHQHHRNNNLHNGLGVSSSSSSEVGFASNNVISSSSSPDPETKPRTLLYGSELSSSQGKPEKSSGSGLEDYWRSPKVAKTGSDDDFSSAFQQRNNNNNSSSLMRSSNNSNNSNTSTTTTTLSFLDNNNNNGGYNSHSQQHQVLSFSSSSSSSPTKSEAHTLPYFPNALPASYTARSTGYNMYQQQQGGMMMMMRSGPFTASQWMELEHQALIYKYITAAVPIPSNLLLPIRKAFDSSSFPPSLLRSTPLGGGWGSAYHLGFSNNADPEPGRCRRTDGKKWRCSRDAVADQKYCERHMNRGRHRSRKPVEGPAAAALAVKPNASSAPSTRMFGKESSREFGAVDTNSLHQFIDSWPERTQLSISIPGGETNVSPLRLSSSTTASWMSSSLGGPLGEALNGTSPTGVLHKPAFGSLSNSSAGSSPARLDVHHQSSSSLPPPPL